VARASRERFQINVPLEEEHWHLALLQLAIRETKSVPEILRPVIVAYLKRQLSADEKLAAAVANMEAARSEARDKSRRRRNLAEVKKMTPSRQARQRANRGRKSKQLDSS
jgi:hypothetical protein